MRRIEIIRKNLSVCFPQLASEEREALLVENAYSTLLGLVDLLQLVWRQGDVIDSMVLVKGEHHLRTALSDTKPLLLITGHYTSFIPMLAKLSRITPFDVLYRRMDNPVLESQLYQRAKRKLPVEAIHRKEVARMLKALSAGKVMVILPDQDFGKKRSIFLPFFGVDTATITAIPQYAKHAGANVMLMHSHRESNGRTVIEFEPALDQYPSGDDTADTQRWLTWLENRVRQRPADYMWLHKRFKTRPPGQPKFY